MTTEAVEEHLRKLYDENSEFRRKNGLSVGLVITRKVRRSGLPQDPDALLTKKGGQVSGLSGTAVARILADYGVHRRLASEGGRTSRGSMDAMRTYVQLLQEIDDKFGLTDELLIVAERFWVARIQDFFDSQPFELNLDPSLGLSAFVREVLRLAEERQRQGGGMQVVGAVLQHLVGAKLEIATRGAKDLTIEHHSFSTADAPGSRQGDFELNDSAVHVTTYPGDAVMERCRQNLAQGRRPVVVTIRSRLEAARQAAEAAGIEERIDIFDVEQFVSLNVYEWSEFSQHLRQETVRDLLETYNDVVTNHETDPSLRIELK